MTTNCVQRGPLAQTLARAVARSASVRHDAVQLELRPLRGGLECEQVVDATARFRDRRGRPQVVGLVAKRLEGAARREAKAYHSVVTPAAPTLAPRLLGVEPLPPDGALLLVERVARASAWPWWDAEIVRRTTWRTGELHEALLGVDPRTVADWDFEAELQERARTTLAVLDGLPREPAYAVVRRGLPVVRRAVRFLPAARRELLRDGPLPTGVIHGDLHPGNMLVRRQRGRPEPVFLDWGRVRLGSPLEDLSSWLISLGTWQADTRRLREALLRTYLRGRGRSARITARLRRHYWLAAASNALSGALLYHLVVAQAARDAATRAEQLRVAGRWLEVVREADRRWPRAR